jgi:hypothetical protein
VVAACGSDGHYPYSRDQHFKEFRKLETALTLAETAEQERQAMTDWNNWLGRKAKDGVWIDQLLRWETKEGETVAFLQRDPAAWREPQGGIWIWIEMTYDGKAASIRHRLINPENSTILTMNE